MAGFAELAQMRSEKSNFAQRNRCSIIVLNLKRRSNGRKSSRRHKYMSVAFGAAIGVHGSMRRAYVQRALACGVHSEKDGKWVEMEPTQPAQPTNTGGCWGEQT